MLPTRLSHSVYRMSKKPLEKAIHIHFIPALIGLQDGDIDGKYRELLTHSVTKGGLTLRNPMDTVASVHEASLDATLHLTRLLVDSAVKFDIAPIWRWHSMLAKHQGVGG